MSKDPYFAALRKEFSRSYTGATQNFNINLAKESGNSPDNIHDMYIRGWLSPDDNDEFRKSQQQNGNIYSAKQMVLLARMQHYIKTGVRR